MLHSAWRLLTATPVAILVSLALAAAAQAAGGLVQKGPAPAWTDEIAAPQPRSERIRQVHGGVYPLLIDRQERLEGDYDVDYRRKVYMVTDRTGLEEAARIDVDIDPSRQMLALHRLRIIRKSMVQDRLAETPVTLLRREEDLDDGVMTGVRTAHLQLRDVQVGDVVEYAFSWRTRTDGGQLSETQKLGWSTPAGLTRLRLLWPHGKPLTIKRFNGAPAGQVVTRGGWEDHQWRMADPEPIPAEDDTPSWYDPWPRIAFSSAASWADVVREELSYYPTTTPVPARWTGEVDRIAKAYPDPNDRITEALRLVQDRLRYVSVSIGAGAYKPRPPAEVVRSGYGDCKDKALLLVVVLRRLGIDAAPALTDTKRGQTLGDAAPGPNAFNHAIVRIRLGGKTFWVDPTRSHEGGRFPDLRALPYGWALPVAPGQAQLEAIPAPGATSPTMDTLERYELAKGADGGLRLDVTTTYRADEADWMRSDIANRSPAEFERKFLSYYAGLYPGLRPAAPLAISDDRDRNLLIIREAYELPPEALRQENLRQRFPVEASTVKIFDAPSAGERRGPLSVDFPINRTHRILLVTPGFKPPAPGSAEIDGAGFRFASRAQRSGDTLQLDYSLSTTSAELQADKVAAFRSEVQRLGDVVYAELDLNSKRGGSADGDVWLGYAMGAIIALGAVAALVVGLWFGLKADATYAAYGRYYPVTAPKFVLMSLVTLGLYDFFWTWKCWRWAKANGRSGIAPFWRAFFRVFWLLPLFQEVNGGLQARALPAALGMTAAATYFLAMIAGSAADRLSWPLAVSIGIPLASSLCLLPCVIAVQRQNTPLGDAVIRRNSRFSAITAAAIAGGAVWWTLVLIGVNS